MTRSVPEWIGATDDAAIPPRVRVRVFEQAGGKCEVCTRKLGPADKWQADHVLAIINGGANRESNLRCICDWCHKAKTKTDVGEKASVYAKKAKHIGAKPKRPWHPGLRKKLNGQVVRNEDHG